MLLIIIRESSLSAACATARQYSLLVQASPLSPEISRVSLCPAGANCVTNSGKSPFQVSHWIQRQLWEKSLTPRCASPAALQNHFFETDSQSTPPPCLSCIETISL